MSRDRSLIKSRDSFLLPTQHVWRQQRRARDPANESAALVSRDQAMAEQYLCHVIRSRDSTPASVMRPAGAWHALIYSPAFAKDAVT